MEPIVAIQGYEGSFHHEAAQAYFRRPVELLPCASFRDVVSAAENKPRAVTGLMAIENSIAGSILPNYHLLQKSRLTITGEVYLHIRQHLLVNKAVRIRDIREVHSHTMALRQCEAYFEKHPRWKLVETEDTALSARHVQQYNSLHIAAVAGRAASERYGLKILARNIHTMKKNYTRFLVLEKEEKVEPPAYADKASVQFQTDHTRGSLARVLTRVAEGGINLSKLQSVPIPGSDFRYSFHADMEFDSVEQFEEVMDSIRPITDHTRIYGLYKKGAWK